MAMNGARFRSIWNNMTPALQKVYGGVPEDNAVSHSAIHAELARKGLARDLHHTQGCLNTLVKMGLIAEPDRGCFTRVEVRGQKPAVPDTWDDDKETATTGEKTMPDTAIAQAFTTARDTLTLTKVDLTPPPTPAPAVKPADPIDRLTKLSASLRALADDIESVALDFTEQLALIESKTQKLEQLRALLKDIA